MADSGISLHSNGHGEVGGPSQDHLAGGQQQREHVGVVGGHPDARCISHKLSKPQVNLICCLNLLRI